ncbi:MAG: ABC transporter ATP-binding protein [Armatimonadetes bacterium]|nr:ABC transporter ATP-binding protein [Armatimonadota bacterium]
MSFTGDGRVSLQNIGKAYGSRRVLSGVSLDVLGGCCVAVVGANGSGKSTLLKIIAGLLRPTRGTVAIGDALDAATRRQLVGYCAPDLAMYPELTGAENLRFFADVRGESLSATEAKSRLDAVGLHGRGNDRVSAYSSGMRQRLRLAFALRGGDVPVLLLDEPSLALDAGGVRLVEAVITAQKKRGGVTILATNDEREATWADERFAVGTVH